MSLSTRLAALSFVLSLAATSVGVATTVDPVAARAGVGVGWSDVTDPSAPPDADAGSPMAHDPVRHQIVQVTATTTWVRDSASGTWVDADPATQPTGVSAVTFDGTLDKVLAVGGVGDGSSGGLLQSWTWDGTDWTLLTPTTAPPMRLGTTMTYDADHGETILFGGHTGPPNVFYAHYLADTWAFDGTTWHEETPATSPSPRARASMVHDDARHEVVLLGGFRDDSLNELVRGGLYGNPIETWVWDGADWAQRTPTGDAPLTRHATAAAYSPTDGLTYLFGGDYLGYRGRETIGIGQFPPETWVWDGTGWTRVKSDSGPSTTAARSATYDSDLGTIVLSNRPWTGRSEGTVWERSATATVGIPGYWLVASDGGVFSFGDAAFHGSAGSIPLNQPIVGMASTPSGNGYWLVARDGGIFAFGDAQFYGSTGALTLNQPVVGMAATPSGDGYWLVARDGGIFAFGDAQFFGSTGALTLNQPVVGMASTPTGDGYWLVAADSGVFAYGDAQFYGNDITPVPKSDVVAITPTPTGSGYWITSAGGGVSALGEAETGSAAVGVGNPDGVVGVARTTFGHGLWSTGSSGAVGTWGEAIAVGDLAGFALNAPIVGIATN